MRRTRSGDYLLAEWNTNGGWFIDREHLSFLRIERLPFDMRDDFKENANCQMNPIFQPLQHPKWLKLIA
jgi:hypothetical protein